MALAPTEILAAALPAGYEREQLMELVTIGAAFRDQQRGRRPGFLRRYVEATVSTLTERTFDALLVELELQAMRRNVLGAKSSPIERVDRAFEIVTWHDPRHGERQTSFKRFRNIAKLRQIP